MAITRTSMQEESSKTRSTPTYARARLWLGMTGVGLQVVIATYVLATGFPHRIKAWHAARTMLFLSYACGGFLARSVHCNLGRPELWIFLPTD